MLMVMDYQPHPTLYFLQIGLETIVKLTETVGCLKIKVCVGKELIVLPGVL